MRASAPAANFAWGMSRPGAYEGLRDPDEGNMLVLHPKALYETTWIDPTQRFADMKRDRPAFGADTLRFSAPLPSGELPEGDVLLLDPWKCNAFGRANRATRPGAAGFSTARSVYAEHGGAVIAQAGFGARDADRSVLKAMILVKIL